jgi:hypothetical protein
MDPAAIDDHHDVFPRFAEGRHHLMQILTQLLESMEILGETLKLR